MCDQIQHALSKLDFIRTNLIYMSIEIYIYTHD